MSITRHHLKSKFISNKHLFIINFFPFQHSHFNTGPIVLHFIHIEPTHKLSSYHFHLSSHRMFQDTNCIKVVLVFDENRDSIGDEVMGQKCKLVLNTLYFYYNIQLIFKRKFLLSCPFSVCHQDDSSTIHNHFRGWNLKESHRLRNF